MGWHISCGSDWKNGPYPVASYPTTMKNEGVSPSRKPSHARLLFASSHTTTPSVYCSSILGKGSTEESCSKVAERGEDPDISIVHPGIEYKNIRDYRRQGDDNL